MLSTRNKLKANPIWNQSKNKLLKSLVNSEKSKGYDFMKLILRVLLKSNLSKKKTLKPVYIQ